MDPGPKCSGLAGRVGGVNGIGAQRSTGLAEERGPRGKWGGGDTGLEGKKDLGNNERLVKQCSVRAPLGFSSVGLPKLLFGGMEMSQRCSGQEWLNQNVRKSPQMGGAVSLLSPSTFSL